MEDHEFGARLRELRKQANLTLRELANRAGVNFTYLSKIESGAMPPPSEKVILQLAEILNADKDELISLAGRLPSDLADVLKSRETLQLLRSRRAKQEARASNPILVGASNTMTMVRNLKLQRVLPRAAIALALVAAVGASLWYASPARAVEVTMTVPSTMVVNRTYTFDAQVDINTNEAIPVTSLRIDITGPTAVYAVFNVAGTITDQSAGENFSSITAVIQPYFGSSSRYGYGYGYRSVAGYGYFQYSGGYGLGYGYGYGGYQAATQARYSVTLDTTGMTTGSYTARMAVIVSSTDRFLSPRYAFSISSAPSRGAGPSGAAPEEAAAGATDVSDSVDEEGVFTEDVTAESEDGNVTLEIEDGTTGLTEEGEPLDEISITEMADPPAPPEGASVVGLTYDLKPDGATFNPAITLTFTYDPDDIPAGVDEADLVIAIWDEDAGDAGEWVVLEGCTVDPVTNTISAPVSHFTAFAILAYVPVAEFAASDLSITPSVVEVGEEVTISVLVTNSGELSGTHELILRVDDAVVATEDVTLDAGGSQTVTFTTSKDVAGTYSVKIDGLVGTLSVKGPAAFATSGLTITPAEVDAGEEVTISVVVANTGDLSGSYKVTLEVDGVAVDTRSLTLDGGASVIVPFTTSRDVAGTYSVRVDGLSGTFKVKTPVVPEDKPAAFTVSQLNISPAEVDVGETVTVSVLVANTGDLSGSYEAVLKIDGVAVATGDVTLKGGASQKVTFTTSRDAAGTYRISVSGQQGTLIVKAPAGIDLWIIIGPIMGVLVVGMIVWWIIRRQRLLV